MISVIVPAHNEHSVISRTLKTMTARAIPGELDVIVVCNGCTDDTAAVAGSFGPPVRVIETGLAGKTLALNLGDKAATFFPRIYADADVHITIETMRTLANRLETGDVLAVAPIANIDLKDCSWLVRAYYEIRSLLPSGREGIGGENEGRGRGIRARAVGAAPPRADEQRSSSAARVHLQRRAPGERDREHLFRPRMPAADQVRDAICDDARLPRSCARKDQQRPVQVQHRLTLFRIQVLKEVHGREGSVYRMTNDGWRVTSEAGRTFD